MTILVFHVPERWDDMRNEKIPEYWVCYTKEKSQFRGLGRTKQDAINGLKRLLH